MLTGKFALNKSDRMNIMWTNMYSYSQFFHQISLKSPTVCSDFIALDCEILIKSKFLFMFLDILFYV
jgi:hypothetical protein